MAVSNIGLIRQAQSVTNPFLNVRNTENFVKHSCSGEYNLNHPAKATPEPYRQYIQNRNADCLDILA